MPYNTRLRGKNPYSEVEKKEGLASPTKKAKLASPTSPTKKSRKREAEDLDPEVQNMKKKLNTQINKLNGTKPSEITPKPNFNKFKKRGAKKGAKRISKKTNEQKRNNILKNVDQSNLKQVRSVVNSEILSKGVCNTINSLGPEKIKEVLKNENTQTVVKNEPVVTVDATTTTEN